MKLSLLAQLTEAEVAPGELTSFGMILVNPSAYKVDYDEIEGIKVFTDEKKFQIELAKQFAKFTGNNDDVFLTYEEICDQPDFDAFCEGVWHWNLFR